MTKTLKAALSAVVAVTFVLGITACTSNPEAGSPVSTNGEKDITDIPTAIPTPIETGTPDLDILPVLVEPAGVPAGWATSNLNGLSFSAPGDWFSAMMAVDIAQYSSMSDADLASPVVNVDGVDYSTNSNLIVTYVTDSSDWKGNWADANSGSYRLNVPGAKYSIVQLGTREPDATTPGQQAIQNIKARVVAEDGREWTLAIHVAQGEYGTSLANQMLASLSIA